MFTIQTLYNVKLLIICTDLIVDSMDREFKPIKVKKEFMKQNYENIKYFF